MTIYIMPSVGYTMLGLLALSWLTQLWFYGRRVIPLAIYKPPKNKINTLPPVSIVICARNEASNLKNLLPSILNQKYPNFEVVVVNDCSTDDSELVLAEFKSQYPHLYYTNIPIDEVFSHGKKLALSIGIKAAKHEHILLTDADCEATSDQWLEQMVQGFSDSSKEIVLGFGGYKKRKGFTNLLVRYDTFFVALQYLGYALSGKPYMGVGRNLAYKKSLFTRNKGFQNHIHIASGDDDLFISEVASKKNTSVIINAKSHTTSLPPRNLKEWREQKSRHLTTSNLHKKSIQFGFLSETTSRFVLLFTATYLIFFNIFVPIAIFAIASKLVIQLILWRRAAKQLNQANLFWAALLFDWFHPILLLWAYSSSIRRNKKRWK